MYLLLLWLGKLIQKASRLFHNSGAALPGLFIERLYPRFLELALLKLPKGVVVISGTNGKTTTTKIVADTLKMLGMRVLTNSSGSNMTRGLVSMIVGRSKIFGQLPFEIAVLEVDEAYASILAGKVLIKGAIVLNIMRDQLDRFGEIDTTAEYLGKLTESVTDVVVLNSSDNRVVRLPSRDSAKKVYFKANEIIGRKIKNDDQWHGGKAHNDTKADVVLTSSDGYRVGLKGLGLFTTKLEGVHNHLNLAAAFGLVSNIVANVETGNLLSLMSKVEPAYGRGERVAVGHSVFDIQLVKNPSSFSQTIRAIDSASYDTVTVAVNDAYADGRDVSWLWDADLGSLSDAKCLYTAGTRAYDIAVRLKYSGISVNDIFDSQKTMVSSLQKKSGSHVIFCTYTAMMSLRKSLVKLGHARKVR